MLKSKICSLAIAITITSALMGNACKSRRGSRLAGTEVGAKAETNEMEWDNTPDWPAKWAEDLPIRGRSLFDQIYFAEAVPPKTFPKLLKLLETKYAAEWNGVLIPYGRSLAAPRTNFAKPRAVVATTKINPNPGLCKFPQEQSLFLGYAEDTDIVEVISYNDALGRYEFQVIAHFGKTTQQLHYVRRAKCTGCHQGGSTIFSFPSWQETNGPRETTEVDVAYVSEEVAKAHPGKKELYGIPISHEEVSASPLDGASDRGGERMGGQYLWRDICGGDAARRTECHARAIDAALPAVKNGPCLLGGIKADEKPYKEFSRLLKESFPKAGIGLPDPNLLDRLPKPFTQRGGPEDPRTIRKPQTTIVMPPDENEGFKVSGGSFGCAGLSMTHTKSPNVALTMLTGESGSYFSKEEQAWLKTRVATLPAGETPAAMRAFAARGSFSKGAWGKAVGTASQWSATERESWESCFTVPKTLPAPSLLEGGDETGVPPPNQSRGIALFRKNCGSCHSGPGRVPYPFLAEKDEAKLSEGLLIDQGVAVVMDDKSMPPRDAKERKALDETEEGKREWKEMLEFLAQ